jgi:hypothetical protein
MSEYKSSGGLSFGSILTLIFVVCKLLHYIDWSWWWVFAPILISAGLTFVILGIILLIAIIVAALK